MRRSIRDIQLVPRFGIGAVMLTVVVAGAVGCVPEAGEGGPVEEQHGESDQPDNGQPGDDPSGEDEDAQPQNAADLGDANSTDPVDCPVTAVDDEPVGMILTWQQDPTTTMTIDWHTEPGDESRSELCLKGTDSDEWQAQFDAEQLDYPFGDRAIHRVEVTGLEPGEEYSFQAGEFGREYRFRTMPQDIENHPVVFAAGGDVQKERDWLEKTNEVVMDYDPDFIVWGGDLAYADARPDKLDRWESFLETNMETLIDDNGRVVPILSTVGNHEGQSAYYYRDSDFEQTDEWRAQEAPYYYTFFASPGQPGYGVLDFSDYMTLFLLDTDHTNPIEGQQTDWLKTALDERSDQGFDHRFAVYHVPAFPSHRGFHGHISESVRDYWVPLFEEYELDIAFENHDHTYKRTHPIRDGQIADDGPVFMGDGAWGVTLRDGDQKDAWYIDEFASERHAIVVTVEDQQRHVLTVNEDGEVIDEMIQPVR